MSGKGRIVRAVAGFFFVHDGNREWMCRGAGTLRKRGIRPVPGDIAEFEITDEKDGEGQVYDILPRKNMLLRPQAANIDSALIIFAQARPDPVFGLLDRMLAINEDMGVKSAIAFNKSDIADRSAGILDIYRNTGYDIFFMSMAEKKVPQELHEYLRGRTTVLEGPSGSGKSSFLNYILPCAGARTGDVSEKIGRGRQTTRHTELYCVERGADGMPATFVLDTPGFSSLDILGIKKENLHLCFPEFRKYFGKCKYADCAHISEDGCAIRDALYAGGISHERHESYKAMYMELVRGRTY